MKAADLKIEKKGYLFSTKTYPKGSHTKGVFSLGIALPNSLSQLKKFTHIDVLNGDDVEKVEKILNENGFKGEYSLTKSKRWARLRNIDDLKKALKNEFK